MDAMIDELEPNLCVSFHTERKGVRSTRWLCRLVAVGEDRTELTKWYERAAKASLRQRLVERLAMGGRESHDAANIGDGLEAPKTILESA